MRYFLYLAACLLPCASAASAASFDCAKASAPVEKMICADPALSKADEELAQAFAAVLSAALNPQGERKEQRDWIGARNKLAGARDLAIAYRNRIDALKASTARWQRMAREIPLEEGATRCVVPADALDDLLCAVDAFGVVENASSARFRFQLQSYRDGDLRVAGGAVVFTDAAGRPGGLVPIATAYAESTHYDPPRLLDSPAARFLLIPGTMEGTGVFNMEALFSCDNGRLRDVDTETWRREFDRRLPKGLAANKGIYPDYVRMTAETPLWLRTDANCCPTGGRATVRLGLTRQRIVIERLSIKRGESAAQ